MIIEALLSPVFLLVRSVAGLFPDLPAFAHGLTTVFEFIGTALYFFPVDVWASALSLFGVVTAAKIGWAIFEWVYRKIPGIS